MEEGYDLLAVPVKLRITPAAARHLASLGIDTVGDALRFAPRRYFHWGRLTSLGNLPEGEEITVLARVTSVRMVRNRSGSGVRLLVGITDGDASLTCTFFAKKEYALSRHQRLLQAGEAFLFGGKVSYYQGTPQLVQPSFEEIESDSSQAIERRQGRPIPIYPAKASLPSWKVAALIDQLLAGVNWDRIPEVVPEEIQSSQSLLSTADAFRLLHQPADDADWQNARRTLAWSEALVLQTALLQPRIKAAREGRDQAYQLPRTADFLTAELLGGLPFELTDGQRQAWATIEADLQGPQAMQRLLQADVGAGKTVVALLALLRAVESGHQAALLAPTEVLAMQHLQSLTRLLGQMQYRVPVHLLTGSQKQGLRAEVLMRLASGEPGIVVGTHALLQDSVELPNLALLVVDEQHRFGVEQRERLREGRKVIPHLLVMTATPIPRTIAMTVFGDLEISAMRDMPPGRRPVATFRVPQDNRGWVERLWQRAREEIDAGGRVYVVCPRITEEPPDDGSLPLPSVEGTLAALQNEPALVGVRMGIAHGQQNNAQALSDFESGRTPLLIATSVVEVGVDVPQATMMVILGAQQFGLSQLHQLRGRVGRSDRSSVCMLVHPAELNPLSEERMQALVDSTDGFALAEADLRLRREGDVLGQQQSGSRSSLRFLSVRTDASIIAAARDAATAILGVDPTLGDHAGLRKAVEDRTGEQLVWLERS